MKFWLLLLLFVFVAPNNYTQSLEPKFEELKQVSQLPAKLPQRITALAWDGEKLWAAIYLDKGRYATFNPKTNEWKIDDNEKHLQSIRDVTGRHSSAGGLVFVGEKLWASSAYGETIGSINTKNWAVEKLFEGRLRNYHHGTQSFSDMTFDGEYLWIAWHWFRYDIPTSETQILLKMKPQTGEILEEFPLPPGGANDGTHALAWDGKNLWHMKDSKLSAIDPNNGKTMNQFVIKEIKRPSGMVWDGTALWVIEFEGKLWRLPL